MWYWVFALLLVRRFFLCFLFFPFFFCYLLQNMSARVLRDWFHIFQISKSDTTLRQVFKLECTSCVIVCGSVYACVYACVCV